MAVRIRLAVRAQKLFLSACSSRFRDLTVMDGSLSFTGTYNPMVDPRT